MLKNVVLPAPFGPMRLTIAAARDREVDVADGDQAAEALRAAGGDEQVAGRSRSPPQAGRPSSRVLRSSASRSVLDGGCQAGDAASASGDRIASSQARPASSSLERGELVAGRRRSPRRRCRRRASRPWRLVREEALRSPDHHDREDDPEEEVVVGRQLEVGQELRCRSRPRDCCIGSLTMLSPSHGSRVRSTYSRRRRR